MKPEVSLSCWRVIVGRGYRRRRVGRKASATLLTRFPGVSWLSPWVSRVGDLRSSAAKGRQR